MNRLSFCALAAATVFVAGCESAPKTAAECANTDWARSGARAVARGEPLASSWSRASRECAVAGFAVNQAAFEQAWGGGFAAYCAPRNALKLGREGANHQNICTPPLDFDFLRAHDMGRVLKTADDDLSRAENAVRKAQAIASDDKKPTADRAGARRDAATAQLARDNAAARISSLEATAAQQGWGLGR